MNQIKDAPHPQIFYQGRWVNKEHFRVFIYNTAGSKLVNSHDEYAKLIESGLWFSSLDEVKPKEPVNIRTGRKPKDGANS